MVIKWLTGTVLVLVLLGGCSAPYQGDCSARIRYEGTLHRPHNAVNQAVPIGKYLVNGDVVGCGGISAGAVDEVKVYAVKGVDVGVAVMTDDGEWHGVYVAAGVPPSSWPSPLKR